MNSLFGLLGVMLFLASILLIPAWLLRGIYLAVHRRREAVRGMFRILGIYLAAYLVVLSTLGLLMPRRTFAAGERECFDDWCVAGVKATAISPTQTQPCTKANGETVWVATLEVSSAAKGIRQRALDAVALLEDEDGHQYEMCAGPLADEHGAVHALSEILEAKESFQVLLAFRLPDQAQPVGVVVSHGVFPDLLIIGSDQSFLHPRTLLRLAIQADG